MSDVHNILDEFNFQPNCTTECRVKPRLHYPHRPSADGQPTVGQYFALFSMFFFAVGWKKKLLLSYNFFHRPTVLRFWSSVLHRPISGRLLMKNMPFKHG